MKSTIHIGTNRTIEVDVTFSVDHCEGDRWTPPAADLTIKSVERGGFDITEAARALGFMEEIEEQIILTYDKN